MAKPVIYYLCTDPPPGEAAGGLRRIYRHVDLLNAHGYDACVLHKRSSARPTWFEHTTPIRFYEEEPGLPVPDFMVIPEVLGPHLPVDAPGMKTIVFNQNAYYSFIGYPDDLSDLSTVYHHPGVVAAMVVSEDSRRYLAYAFPDLPIERVQLSLDPALFYHPGQKRRQIAYMPRKRPEQIAQVLNILKFRGALEGFDIVKVEGVGEAEAARMLRESMVFLSAGYPEGWPLPPFEALACGCLTVGYHGLGGREYFLPEYGFPIEIYDIVGFARTLEEVLQRCRREPDAMDALAKRAAEYIRTTFPPEREEREFLAMWQRLAGAPPA